MTTDEYAQKGMTLVEVLVALAILGLTVGSVFQLIGQTARFISVSEERLLARIIVDNVMVETLAHHERIEETQTLAELEFGGQQWTYERDFVATGVQGIFRVDVRVRPYNRDQVLAHATTLKAQ